MKPSLFLSGLVLLGAAHAALLPAAAPPAGPTPAEVGRLIKQLGDDDPARREAATARLKLAGEPALPALHKATGSGDLEVRRRARRVVAAVEARLYGPELCLTGHKDKVFSVCVSADGKRLLTRSADRTLRLWDAHTGKCLRVFTGQTARDCGAALSPDGKRVLSGGEYLRLWDADTGKELRRMGYYRDGVFRVAFGPQGKALTGSADAEEWALRGSYHGGNLCLWDLDAGKRVLFLKAHPNEVLNVLHSEKARLVATNSTSDMLIRLWDLKTGKQVRELKTDTSEYRPLSICFSPDGKSLLGVVSNSFHIWDVKTGKLLMKIETDHSLYAFCVAFSPDGRRIVSGGGWFEDRPGEVKVWDVTTGKKIREYEGHTNNVVGVAFFPDGKRIVSASFDGTARIWRVPR